MIENVFPYRLHLTVFQLEGYSIKRFVRWILLHPFTRKLETKKGLVWTFKSKFICFVAICLAVSFTIFLGNLFGVSGCILGIVVSTQSYLFLVCALLLLKPYELCNRCLVKRRIKRKIESLKLKGLKVIGITGSYGKTSIKEVLYQLLKTKYSVLRTPESYNTLFGIEKVVDLELDDSYGYFICEMGAYKRGEIRELCDIVLPDYAILTGINEQHVERFGSIQNTIKAKFELIQAVNRGEAVFINGNDSVVAENFHKFISNPIIYGPKDSEFFVENVLVGKSGTTFTLQINGKRMKCKTLLPSNGNLSNILGAVSLSYNLGVKDEDIIRVIHNLKPIPHRLELKGLNNGNYMIDNAYSSNTTGFMNALDFLRSLDADHKVLVTPGIVELGGLTKEVHLKLGAYAAGVCDMVILVGKNERIRWLEEGINKKSKIIIINTISALSSLIEKLNIKNSVILVENDLPENY